MADRVLSPKYFMRRHEHLLRAADRLAEEADGMELRTDEAMSKYVVLKFKADLKYNEASTISMMIHTMEHYGNEEAKEIIAKERSRS